MEERMKIMYNDEKIETPDELTVDTALGSANINISIVDNYDFSTENMIRSPMINTCNDPNNMIPSPMINTCNDSDNTTPNPMINTCDDSGNMIPISMINTSNDSNNKNDYISVSVKIKNLDIIVMIKESRFNMSSKKTFRYRPSRIISKMNPCDWTTNTDYYLYRTVLSIVNYIKTILDNFIIVRLYYFIPELSLKFKGGTVHMSYVKSIIIDIFRQRGYPYHIVT